MSAAATPAAPPAAAAGRPAGRRPLYAWIALLLVLMGIGVAAFVKETERMARAYGPRYRAPKLLRDMAKGGRTFYAA